MRSFISFHPGEHRGCVGCHETRAEAPAGEPFPMALLRDPVAPEPSRDDILALADAVREAGRGSRTEAPAPGLRSVPTTD